MNQVKIRPEDYIITRKRKKYKFAKFALSPLCFEFNQWMSRSIDVIEVGAGDGLFSVELATLHPEQSFMALDVKGDRLQKGALEAESRGLVNISFVRARADQLSELMPARSVRSIWLTFPDPFPKKRAKGRRLTHATFLRHYQDILASDGRLYLKHDNLDFFHWSLEQFVADKWCIKELIFDLHASKSDDHATILTSYEKRWLDEGRAVSYCQVAKL